MSAQLTLAPLVEEDTEERARAADRYAVRHRDLYLGYAKALAPDLRVWSTVWDRVAFAILTANAETSSAHLAFREARQHRRHAWPACTVPGIVPERVRYVNALPKGKAALSLLRRGPESWHEYRLRLVEQVEGLGITKGSYAACLLYPLAADVACLDTWLLKLVRPGTSRFTWVSTEEYVRLEDQVRAYARRHRVSTAVGQWMLWDFIRTGRPTPQRFFD